MITVFWHRLDTPGFPGVRAANERQFTLHGDGVTIKDGVMWRRNPATKGEWVLVKLSNDVNWTRESLEGFLGHFGYAPGQAPARYLCPDMGAISRWLERGDARSIDGCEIDVTDAECHHGSRSWLRVYQIRVEEVR